MRNAREEIEYHNRKFKYSLVGRSAGAEFIFDLQPPNEFAFSSRYSQCLVKINHAYISNRGDTTNHGLDAIFMDEAGAVELMAGGCLLLTDIRTSNSINLSTNRGPVAGAGGFQVVKSGVQAVLHNKRGTVSAAGADAYLGTVVAGASQVTRGFAAAGTGAQGVQQNEYSVNMWEYKDDRSIEDSGVLCANPFGHKFGIKCFSADNGNRVLMTSGTNIGVAASNGSCINLELEILMLPNPTVE